MAEKNKTNVVKKVLRHVRPYWIGLIASLLLATVYVVMSLYIPILVGDAIDCIVDAGQVDFDQMATYLMGVALCAGAAGIAAAEAAWDAGCKSILLADRRPSTGGILLQCRHRGFGNGLNADYPVGIRFVANDLIIINTESGIRLFRIQ